MNTEVWCNSFKVGYVSVIICHDLFLILQVFVSSEPQISLLKYLEPVLPVLFELYFVTSSSASQLR